jgi:thioredoxin-dependent peroxiredoxin
MISVGQKPDLAFPVKVVTDGTVREILFSELLTRPTVVSVYMKNNTTSCDRQNDSLVAVWPELDRAGYNLVALSRDTVGSHRRFAAAKTIKYTLVSDPGDAFAKAMGSLVPKTMYGREFVGPVRATFVFACDGTVVGMVEKVDARDHANQLRQLIKSL